jgi:hypothetical protein
MKRAGFVCLYLFLSATLLGQSDSGSVIDPPRRLLRPVPDFRRLVPPVGEGRKLHVGDSVSALDTAQSSVLSFAPVVDYDSGGGLVAVADVNGDGKPDVVVVANSEVGVQLGNGDGTFQPVVAYNLAESTLSVQSAAVADVNGDGRPDIVLVGCASAGSNGRCATGFVNVLFGNGDGTFQPAVSYGSGGGGGAESVAVADVNGDGTPDLVVANSCPGVDSNGDCTIVNGIVSVLLGNGDGTFQPAVSYGSGGQEPTSVALADLNGDGRPDIVVANYCPSHSSSDDYLDLCQFGGYSVVGVLLGNGDGTFQMAAVYNSGGYYTASVAVADLNGDEKPDLVVGNGSDFWPDFENGAVGILLGNGDGTFQPTVQQIFAGFGSSAAVTDLNGDGKPDLVAASYNCSGCANGDSGLGVLLGNGDGTFQAAVIFDSGGDITYSIGVADVNGDRRPDLLLANGGLGVLINTTPWPTTAALATSFNPSDFGRSLTFTVSVTSQATGTPTGTVIFSDGSNTLGSFALSGETATLTTAALVAGPHNISAVYSGDSNFSGSSASLNQTVNQAGTTLTLASSANPSGLDQPVTFTAMISPQLGGQATGTVIFKDGAMTLGSVAVSGNAASLTTISLAISAHSITAFYGGDGNYIGSTSNTLSQIVTKSTATTTLLSSLNPSVAGKSVTFTATVSSLAATRTGTVQFLNGTALLATVTLKSGTSKYTTSQLPPGTDAITAVYSGDTNNSANTSGTVNQLVQAPTTITLTSSPASSAYGQAVIFTGEVTSSIGAPPDGEAVSFKQGSTVLGTGILSSGMASISVSTLGVGDKAITGVYGGDANFTSSKSEVLSQVVGAAATTTTLVSSVNSSNDKQSVTFTATVVPQFGGTVTGSVTFMDGATMLKTVGVSGGIAKYTTSTLAPGTHNITATYNGSTYFTRSSGAVTQTVD